MEAWKAVPVPLSQYMERSLAGRVQDLQAERLVVDGAENRPSVVEAPAQEAQDGCQAEESALYMPSTTMRVSTHGLGKNGYRGESLLTRSAMPVS